MTLDTKISKKTQCCQINIRENCLLRTVFSLEFVFCHVPNDRFYNFKHSWVKITHFDLFVIRQNDWLLLIVLCLYNKWSNIQWIRGIFNLASQPRRKLDYVTFRCASYRVAKQNRHPPHPQPPHPAPQWKILAKTCHSMFFTKRLIFQPFAIRISSFLDFW